MKRDIFVSLYPNPAWSTTTVQIHGAQIKRTRMMDLNGRQVAGDRGAWSFRCEYAAGRRVFCGGGDGSRGVCKEVGG